MVLMEGGHLLITQGPHLGKNRLVIQMDPTHCLVMMDHPVRCDGYWIEKIHCQWKATVWQVGDLEYVFHGNGGPALDTVCKLMRGFLPIDNAAVRWELGLSPDLRWMVPTLSKLVVN